MTLEIEGSTINGFKAFEGFKPYSNYMEDTVPGTDGDKIGKKWQWTSSQSHYAHTQFYRSEDKYLRIKSYGTDTSTGGGSTGTIYTVEDLRKYKEFYFAGSGSTRSSDNNRSRYISFGLSNSGGSSVTGGNTVQLDVDGITSYHGWFIHGKFKGDQLEVTYGGTSCLTTTTTITVTGLIRVWFRAYAYGDYPGEATTYADLNIGLVK